MLVVNYDCRQRFSYIEVKKQARSTNVQTESKLNVFLAPLEFYKFEITRVPKQRNTG